MKFLGLPILSMAGREIADLSRISGSVGCVVALYEFLIAGWRPKWSNDSAETWRAAALSLGHFCKNVQNRRDLV